MQHLRDPRPRLPGSRSRRAPAQFAHFEISTRANEKLPTSKVVSSRPITPINHGFYRKVHSHVVLNRYMAITCHRHEAFTAVNSGLISFLGDIDDYFAGVKR